MKRNYARELFDTPTDRDRQTKIGPSLMGSPCNRCIARGLSGGTAGELGPFVMGGKIGTAIHSDLEAAGRRRFPNDRYEIKLPIGTIPGYGLIKGTIDRVDMKRRIVVDYKSTTKKKVPGLMKAYDAPAPVEKEPNTAKEARFKLRGYVGQGHLYARAVEDAFGIEIEGIALSFVPRDAVTLDDLFQLDYDYDRAFADAIWDRVVYIWDNLNTEEWASDPYCYSCNNE